MFAPWKRLEKMANLHGSRIVVGYNYRNPESSDLISLLFGAGVAIWTNTTAATLASLFRSSRSSSSHLAWCVFVRPCRRLYVPATKFGGGERLIWEARVAGVRQLGACLDSVSAH
jgi:hypothetical protein